MVNGKLYGNTEYVATLISQKTGGDLFQIKTEQTYPGTHKELIDAAKKEADGKVRPKLATHIRNLKDYDVIFVGFPNWWYDMPMPLYSFFDEYDFTGKTLIPFCTHGGSRFSQTEKTIASLEKGAKMRKGLATSHATTWVHPKHLYKIGCRKWASANSNSAWQVSPRMKYIRKSGVRQSVFSATDGSMP